MAIQGLGLETVMRVLENASYTADLVAGAKACKNLGISFETWTDWQIVKIGSATAVGGITQRRCMLVVQKGLQ